MQIYLRDDIGGRDEQQDSCAIFKGKYFLFMVLGDGMGGHKGGALASKTLIEESEKLFELYQEKSIPSPKIFFQEIIDNLQERLKQYVEEDPDIDPHTTCVFALIQDNILHAGHIGDSRVYIFIDKKFLKRSRDHSVVEIHLINGDITEEEMATHPDQNRLLKSIGGHKAVSVTYQNEKLPEDKENAVLICSDGFWEQISTPQMEEEIFTKPLNISVDNMVDFARTKGGETGDNISVAVWKSDINSNKFSFFKKKRYLFLSILWFLLFCGLLYFLLFGIDTSKQIDINSSLNQKKEQILKKESVISPADSAKVLEYNQTKDDKNITHLHIVPDQVSIGTNTTIPQDNQSTKKRYQDEQRP